jgi:hypothetical protein
MSKGLLYSGLIWVFLFLIGTSGVRAESRDSRGFPEFYDAHTLDLSKLSPDEQAIYARGHIGTGRYVAGGLVGTFVGLGAGHAVIGEYSNIGWAFTVGEVAGMALLMSGVVGELSCLFSCGVQENSNNNGLIAIGAALYYGFRIWEIVDVWVRPTTHNDRYRMLYWRLKNDPSNLEPKAKEGESTQILPFVDPAGRASLGLVYRF